MKVLFSIAHKRFPLVLLTLLFFWPAQSRGDAWQFQSSTGSARPIPAADSKLIEVKVTGSKRFSQADVAAASGLQFGTIVDEEAFRKAARQLGESGAFNDIAYTYSYSSAGTKLTLQVKDANKFVPAHFLDFVWFSDPELIQKIHERVPLFNG
ncbi:MAG: POTRA domain-containing protein, partial [Candidatus Sulfotelmatobacter sp.]